MFAASQPITLQHSLHLKADFMFETPKSRSAFNTAFEPLLVQGEDGPWRLFPGTKASRPRCWGLPLFGSD